MPFSNVTADCARRYVPAVPAIPYRAYSKTCPPPSNDVQEPPPKAVVNPVPSDSAPPPIHDPDLLPWQLATPTCTICVVAAFQRMVSLAGGTIQDRTTTVTKFDASKHDAGEPYDPLANQDLKRPPVSNIAGTPPWTFAGWTFQRLAFEVATTWVDQYGNKRVTTFRTPKVSQSNFNPGPHGAYSGTELLYAPAPSTQGGAYAWSMAATGGRWVAC